MDDYTSAARPDRDEPRNAILAAVDQQQKLLSALREALGEVRDRMTPLLRPERGATIAAGERDTRAAEAEPASPLLTQIRKANSHAEVLIATVRELASRVE